jgi:hypothetical protein
MRISGANVISLVTLMIIVSLIPAMLHVSKQTERSTISWTNWRPEMIAPKQLRELIRHVLTVYGGPEYASESAIELLMLTAAQESRCGRFLRQLNGGPARGIFQIEPWVVDDLWENFLQYPKNRQERTMFIKAQAGTHHDHEAHLQGNLVYQIVVARLQYFRFSEPIPAADDVGRLAGYWKRYWNTAKGAGTAAEAIENYNKYTV